MKVAALALLLANLILYGWLYTHPQQPSVGVIRTTQLPASVEPLMLLRERAQKAESEHEPLPVRMQAGPMAEPGVQQPSPDSIDTAQNAIPARSEMPSQPIDAESSPVAASDMAPVGASETAPTPPSERLCQTIGPFPVRAEADTLAETLTALGREPAIRTSQVEQPSGYWVYLPSMPRAEARRIIDDLAAKGVKDYFLGRQNFISLGVFSDKRSADMRMQDITSLGYAPRLEPRFHTREVFWIDLEEPSSERIDDAQWAELLKNRPELRRQPVACE